MAIFEVFTSISSLLYLLFLVLAIKETIGLIATIGGGSKGKSTTDRIGEAWDKVKGWNDNRKVKRHQKELERQEDVKKQKQEDENLGRFIANIGINSADALNVIAEGTQKLQEIIQNAERDYATVSKPITEKIALPMKNAGQKFNDAEQKMYPALRNEHTLTKNFSNSVKSVIQTTQQEIKDNTTEITKVQGELNKATKELPVVTKELPIKENELKQKQTDLDTEKKATKPNNRKIAGLNKSIANITAKIDQLRKNKASYEKVIAEAGADIKKLTDVNNVLDQKVQALTDLLNRFNQVQLPDDNKIIDMERRMTVIAQNIKKETTELHDNFEKLSKLNIDKSKTAQDVGTHKQRIEQSVIHLSKEIGDFQALQNDRLLLISAIRDGKKYRDEIYSIEQQTNQALQSLGFWNINKSTSTPATP